MKFGGLHAFRSMAAIAILLHHIEEFKKFGGLGNIGNFKLISSLGGTAVTAFFVLSGFLITYLLISEKERYGNISIKHFFSRRFLRIWPLYFLTLILYKLILPNLPLLTLQELEAAKIASEFDAISTIQIPDWLEWLFLLGFMPHVLLALGVVYNPAHVWSIGVEEMFYLFWPFIVRNTKRYIQAFFKVIGVYLFLLLIFFVALVLQSDNSTTLSPFLKFCFSFLYFERISCMAIGAIGAVMVLKQQRFLYFLRSPFVVVSCFAVLFYMVGKGVALPILTNEIYAFIFLVIIINIIHKNFMFSAILNNSVFRFMGDISYGIYMYNPFTILLTIEIFKRLALNQQSFLVSYIMFYFVSFVLTISISSVSFYFFEKKFLSLKKYRTAE